MAPAHPRAQLHHSSSFAPERARPEAIRRSVGTMAHHQSHSDVVSSRNLSPENVLSRRQFVGSGALAAAALAFGPSFWRHALASAATPGAGPYGALGAADANGLMLPAGFRSREIARSGASVGGYAWHANPDGAATFATPDGGWVLVSNAESSAAQGGGASSIEFAPDGSIKRAQRILSDSERNCSGGHTPWGTYLSCEEWEGGQVWECDPLGRSPAQVRPAMGVFTHESACVDPANKRVYMTEDEDDGRLYRFTPNSYPNLGSGTLEIATVGSDGTVHWAVVPDPSAISAPTREQVAGTRFAGGEGMWFDSGIVYFTTKKDNKVHAYHTGTNRYELIYDEATTPGSPLSGLDGMTVSRSGDLFLVEDGDDLDVCMITPDRVVARFAKLTGAAHADSELTGVCFDPSGTRMYFSSMRGYGQGATYEVSGPFRGSGRSSAPLVFGATAGGTQPAPQPAAEPNIRLEARRRMGLTKLLRRGLTVRVEVTQPGTVSLALRTGEVLTALKRGDTEPQPRKLLLARSDRRLSSAGTHTVRLRLSRETRRKLLRARRASRVMLTAQLKTKDGKTDLASRRLRIRR
jgi:secreted PhoX family phosphatase